jgi:hypothetical protein
MMETKLAGLIFAATLLLTAFGPVHAMGERPQTYDVSGQVLDVTTGNPLQGVLVVAKHERSGSAAFAHSSMWCVKTVGLYTDAEGRFRFTYEDGRQPDLLIIKPGYYTEYKTQNVNGIAQVWPKTGRYDKADKDYGSPRQHVNLYMRPQDPAKPVYRYGDDRLCDRATSPEEAKPMVDFYTIEVEEFKKYGADTDLIQSSLDRIKRQTEIGVDNQNKK